jgi:F-type H+-transporting ATPase subunit gamma
MKAIKRRIVSVNNTQQIMKAMYLVAASKLQKTKTRLESIRPLYEGITSVINGISENSHGDEIPFAEKREAKNAVYIVITSDRGLCGGYNTNVAKEALAHIVANIDKAEKIISVGTKGRDYFKRRGKNVVHRVDGVSEATTFENAEQIGDRIISMYQSGEADEVYLVYTHFESVLSHSPRVEQLLPIQLNDTGSSQCAMTFDPDIETFAMNAVPIYVSMFIYGAMMESIVCEEASRMTSMDSATRNASKILDSMTLEYNRKRQGMITQEITEIVSGANALQ